jgi:class 3 adenylate cyclase
MVTIFYVGPGSTAGPRKFLVARPDDGEELRFAFYERVEIGRHKDGRNPAPGLLAIDEPTISRRHCVITQTQDGRCYVRDVSRNGTRIDGRRLVPNVEFEIQVGQTLGLGTGLEFRLDGPLPQPSEARSSETFTTGMPASTVATIVVGDIRDYTVLVRRAPTEELQHSVSRVFDLLSEDVVRLGGTVKEYQGDALFAFWERGEGGDHAVDACSAVLELDRRARQIAEDASVWQVDDFRLEMDWALATGDVAIDTFGGSHPTGLSMVGEPVVAAFRLEKFANEETGRIVACSVTQKLASTKFHFRDLGEMQAKGFDQPYRVFALLGSRGGEVPETEGPDTLVTEE